MVPISTYVVLAIYLGFGLLELWRSDLFKKREQTRDDAVVEVASTVILLGLTQPAIVLLVARMSTCWRMRLCGTE